MLRTELLHNLARQNIRPSVYREVIARLNAVAPTNVAVPDPASGSSRSRNTADPAQPAVSPEGPAPPAVHAQRPGGALKHSSSAGALSGSQVAPLAASQPGVEGSAVPVVHVHSERELVAELEAMAEPLSGTAAEWQQRIGCMLRLEGLAAGCGLHLQDTLLDHFKCVQLASCCLCI